MNLNFQRDIIEKESKRYFNPTHEQQVVLMEKWIMFILGDPNSSTYMCFAKKLKKYEYIPPYNHTNLLKKLVGISLNC